MVGASYAATVDYYVDPTGTDDGSHGTGTGTDAWATIQYAITNAANPTTDIITINIAAGTYTQGGVTINRAFNDLTLNGAGASNTILQAHATEGSGTDRVIYAHGTDETVTIQNLWLRNGNHSSSGGGIFNSQSDLTLINCIISENAGDFGAGIYSVYGSLNISGCTISGNNATDSGGAIYVTGSMTMTNTTVFDNTASDVGGIYGHYGLGVYTITNCTIASNTSSSAVAGGFYNWDGTTNIKNTILANNSSSEGAEDFEKWSGTVNDNDYNIVEYFSGTGVTFGSSHNLTGNQTNLNLSSTLALNNATTGTLTLKTTSGSVAINAGNTSANNGVTPPTTDQRGASRNGTIDIGAYEYFSDDGSLPVELSAFTANSNYGSVQLSWTTSSEIENLGFILERALRQAQGSNVDPAETWSTIASFKTHQALAGQGSTTSETKYQFSDNTVSIGETYEYRLSDVDYQGKKTPHTAVSVVVRSEEQVLRPGVFVVNSIFPNPFNPSTTLSYTLDHDMQVSISILDIRGRLVKSLAHNLQQTTGSYELSWDGMNNHGGTMTSGIYFLNIQGPGFSHTAKLVKLD